MLNLPQDLPNPQSASSTIKFAISDCKSKSKTILITTIKRRSTHFKSLFTFQIIPNPAEPRVWKIALPKSMSDVLKRYHVVLGHCGYQQLYNIIWARFQMPTVQATRVAIWSPTTKNAHHSAIEWSCCELDRTLDRHRQWHRIRVQNPHLYWFYNQLGWSHSNLKQNKTSQPIADQFKNCWLSNFPKPNKYVLDNGGEFIGQAFLLAAAGIQSKPTTVKNPQLNAIYKQLHLTMGNILRLITRTNPRNDEE